MKKMFVLICLTTAFCMSAQAQKTELDYYQSIYGMEKKAVVSDLIQLKPQQKDAFWALYGQYETSRKALGEKRINLLETYAENYDNMDAGQLNTIVNDAMGQTSKNEKLINTYYKKMKKTVDPVVAAQFYQVETYLHSEIRAAIFGNIPMVKKIMEKK